MNASTLEIEIAEATKNYLRSQWHLDVSAFKDTKNPAWVGLAGRILEKPGVLIPAKRRTGRGARIGDVK
jgi:hypothetical protein